MYTVIRNYTGTPGLGVELQKRSMDIEAEITSVPGFIAYYFLKTSEGIATVTVCEDRAGCDESTKRAANWLRQNLPNLKVNAPQVIAGELGFRFANYKTKV
jgi:hypothetical protein